MPEISSFQELNLDSALCRVLSELGFERPTPIQSASIEKLMLGYDLVGQAKTGTGKTAAFALPMIELIDPDEKRPQGLVLSPTRELCAQIAREFTSFLKYKSHIRAVALTGGEPISHQISDLKKGSAILVATPGRLLDHLRRHTLKLDQLQMVVLDEADQMLDMGFFPDIDLILSLIQQPHQTVLYSATMPDEILSLSEKYMEEPIRIKDDESQTKTVEAVTQQAFVLKNQDKPEALRRLIWSADPFKCLIFCNTKSQAGKLYDQLMIQKELFTPDNTAQLHGDLKQFQRDKAILDFKEGSLRFLIATDVAARGLDIDGVDLVINYELPEDPKTYLHRIGRTARAGREGLAYSLVSPSQSPLLQKITDYTKVPVPESKLPSLQDVQEKKALLTLEKVSALLKKSRFSKYLPYFEPLLSEGYSFEEIAAALLALSIEPSSEEKPLLLGQKPTSFVKLHLSAGKKEGLKVKHITLCLSDKLGIPSSWLGRIDLLEHFTYVEVPAIYQEEAIEALSLLEVKGVTLTCSLAKT